MKEPNTINKAEEKVSKFYNQLGWETEGQITEDAKRFEDLRQYASEYISKCRLRILRHIPKAGGKRIIDMASGPIQYPEYLEYSKNFEKRYCVDLSDAALYTAKKRIGDHGEFWHGSFFDLPIEDDFFDCSLSLHTIYHMDKDKQEEAVRKLIRITKTSHPVIIIYSNPNILLKSSAYLFLKKIITFPFRALRKLGRMFFGKKNNPQLFAPPTDKKEKLTLYFHPHPIGWWKRFGDVAEVNIYPWRSFWVKDQQTFFPNNAIGKTMLSILFKLEDTFPDFFVKHFQYPMIVLKKK